jgi:type VI protein secretion system component VasF
MPTETVRADLIRILDEMKGNAAKDRGLVDQYEQIRLPLVFFADFIIRESRLAFRSEWAPLAYDEKQLAGDEKFFDILDADLLDHSPAAAERLAVYYTCLGLGFSGFYMGQPEVIEELMTRIAGRISGLMDPDERPRLCSQAYEHTNTRDYTEPPGAKLVGIGILLVGLIVVWFLAYVVLFREARRDVQSMVDAIVSPAPTNDVQKKVDTE